MSNFKKDPQLPPKSSMQGLLLILLVGAALVIILFTFNNNPLSSQTEKISYSNFLKYIEENKIEKVIIQGNWIKGNSVSENKMYKVYIPYPDPELLVFLRENNVEITGEEVKDSSNFWFMLIMIGSSVVLVFLIFGMLSKQVGSANNQAFSFGKARTKMYVTANTKFSDVAGVEEAKQELVELVEYLKNPMKFISLGAKIPRGVLLIGPPGCGKTLLAKAVAGEANVPFFSISGSDFVEMFVGVGASRVRDLFAQAKKNTPAIIFIDELDAVGRSRGAGLGGGHDEREQTLNQMLVEMDGFDTNDAVIVLAATNRPDILDKALLRPGRFDRQVVVDKPDIKGRFEILKIHTKKVPVAKEVDLYAIARGTPGFSGADLANLVNEAAILAGRFSKSSVSMELMEEAKDKVMMGPERKSRVISSKERTITAYHEAGHTIMHILLKHIDPVYKVTIIPRGLALGLTHSLPLDERYMYTKSFLLEEICALLGGRVAEENKFNELSSGAASDIERATQIAHEMVCKWGMSDLGPIQFGNEKDDVFLGKDLIRERNYSEDTAKKVDNEINRIITECHDRTKKLIMDNADRVDLIANTLIEKESLLSDEIYKLLGMENPHKDVNGDFNMVNTRTNKNTVEEKKIKMPQKTKKKTSTAAIKEAKSIKKTT